MAGGDESGKTYLTISQGKETYKLGCFSKNGSEQIAMDVFFSTEEPVTFAVAGKASARRSCSKGASERRAIRPS